MRAVTEPGLRMGNPSTTGPAFSLFGFMALRQRIEASIARHGLDYPWWIPIIAVNAFLVCAAVAVGQRGAWWPVEPIAVTVLLVVVPCLAHLGTQVWVPWWLQTVAAFAATAWLLSDPVQGVGSFDIAPALLAILTSQVVARDGLLQGTVVAALSLVFIGIVASQSELVGEPVHLLDILLGHAIGCILLWQMRALKAEREARAGEGQQATLAERQRIAREVHDLVAHSLSVTLLHIAGARHTLADAKDPAAGLDVDEVDAALLDAERVGRQAMSDIRQTVSSLGTLPTPLTALPRATDIAQLVSDVRAAGFNVAYVERGDPSLLAQSTGLGLYRMAQESLTNMVKHAPDATAHLILEVSPTQARLTARNTLPAVRCRSDGRGRGLAGMQERAEQLGATLVAGPENGEWLVDVHMRLRQRNGQLWCGRTITWGNS